jgi:oxalate decarboxylase/phosphoglucose isomerase-like protein (cupin superfamily)
MRTHGEVTSDVPQEVLDEILEIANNYAGNDLGGDNYQISQHCDVKTAFTASETYSQILLQQLDEGADNEVDETNYNNWRDDLSTSAIQKYLSDTFKAPYRARISVMHGGNELNYHIDTDTSVLCRVQIPVQTKGSLFQWKTKKEEVSLDMQAGCTYFVNTGWLHRVTNDSDNTRIVLIFGVDYNNIPNKEQLLTGTIL